VSLELRRDPIDRSLGLKSCAELRWNVDLGFFLNELVFLLEWGLDSDLVWFIKDIWTSERKGICSF
jgi:hypothetical protein